MLIAVDDALEALAGRDPAKARLIEMRYFGGLTAEESAEGYRNDGCGRAPGVARRPGLAAARLVAKAPSEEQILKRGRYPARRFRTITEGSERQNGNPLSQPCNRDPFRMNSGNASRRSFGRPRSFPPEQQAAMVAAVTATDPAVGAEVESLLRADRAGRDEDLPVAAAIGSEVQELLNDSRILVLEITGSSGRSATAAWARSIWASGTTNTIASRSPSRS